MPYYGRAPGLGDAELGTLVDDARASTYGAMPVHGWGYRWVGRVGRAFASSPSARGEVWNTSNGNPAGLHGYTNTFLASQPAFSTGNISDVSQLLVEPIQLFSGTIYAVGVATTGPQMNHGLNNAPAGQNGTLYHRSISNLGPHDPMGYTSTIVAGQGAWGIEYDTNLAPNKPVLSGAKGTVLVPSPAFEIAFSDPNQTVGGSIANPKEKLKQYRLQMRVKGSPSLLWNATYSASSAEQAANMASRQYGGALTPGEIYEWRGGVSDQYDAWSPWSDEGGTGWTEFTIESGASLTNPGGVTGKQNTTTPNGFSVTYAHETGLSANAVQIEIQQGGTPVRTAQQFTINWTPGAGKLINPNWSNWSPLDWGVAYTWTARVRDTAGLWSDWTSPMLFWTNARPTVPTNLRPSNGAASSTRPKIMFSMTDADDSAPVLIGRIRLKSEAGAILSTLTMNKDTGTDWSRTLSSGDLPDYGTYRWDAQGDDGVLQSAWSAEQTFVYQPGPTINITSPTEGGTVTSSVFQVQWTVDDQVRRRAHVWDYATGEKVYQSAGWTQTTGTTVTLDGSSWIRNGRQYEVAIEVENSFGIAGMSQRRLFTVEYPPAPLITGVSASAETATYDEQPSVFRVGWDQSSLSTGVFGGYEVYRLAQADYNAIVGGSLTESEEAAAILDAGELIGQITSITGTVLIDPHPPSGSAFAYAVIQRQYVGVDVVSSRPAVAVTEPLELVSIIISDRDYGTSRRVVLDYLGAAQLTPVRGRAILETWDPEGEPTVAESPTKYIVLRNSFALVPRGGLSPLAQVRLLNAMQDARDDDSPTVVIYRDDLGFRLEGAITDVRASRGRLGRFDVEIEITGVEV